MVAGVKALVLLLVVALGQSVLAADKKPSTKEALDIRDEQPIPSGPEYAKIIEAAIRVELKKLTGELTEADLEKVTSLNLNNTIMLDEGLKELPKLKNLRSLNLNDTKVTKAGMAELRKALPNCKISGNPKK